MKNYRIIILLLILVCLPIVAKSLTVAARGDPWYTIESIEVSLPDDFPGELQVEPDPSSPHLLFNNPGKNPIYLEIEDGSDKVGWFERISREEYRSFQPVIFDKLSYPQVPYYKLVNNQEYQFERGGYAKEQSYNLMDQTDGSIEDLDDWDEPKNDFIKDPNGGWLEIHIKDLGPKVDEVWGRGDHRPKNLKADPQPIPFKYEVFYATTQGGQFYTVNGTVDLALNENYNPTAREDALERAHENWPPNSNSDFTNLWDGLWSFIRNSVFR